jgi:hypothetical protein
MKHPALMDTVGEEIELPQARAVVAREAEVGVELLAPHSTARTAPSLPWVTEAEAPPAFAQSSQPIWLSELELAPAPPPAPTAPPPPPRRTAPTPPAVLSRLREQTAAVEVDPFEALLEQKKVTANELAPGAEPTIQELSPLGAQERWWIDPRGSAPKPKATVDMRPRSLTPPEWRVAPSRPRPTPPAPHQLEPVAAPRPRSWRTARIASAALAAGLCAVIGFTLLGGRHSLASAELVVPPPPEREAAAALAPAPVEPAPVAAPAPAPKRDSKEEEQEKLLKRARAAKKWAAESWPAPKVEEPVAAAPAAEPPPPADELKRPEF